MDTQCGPSAWCCCLLWAPLLLLFLQLLLMLLLLLPLLLLPGKMCCHSLLQWGLSPHRQPRPVLDSCHQLSTQPAQHLQHGWHLYV
jgi:hypothetical protein